MFLQATRPAVAAQARNTTHNAACACDASTSDAPLAQQEAAPDRRASMPTLHDVADGEVGAARARGQDGREWPPGNGRAIENKQRAGGRESGEPHLSTSAATPKTTMTQWPTTLAQDSGVESR